MKTNSTIMKVDICRDVENKLIIILSGDHSIEFNYEPYEGTRYEYGLLKYKKVTQGENKGKINELKKLGASESEFILDKLPENYKFNTTYFFIVAYDKDLKEVTDTKIVIDLTNLVNV